MTCEAVAPQRCGSALGRGWQYSLAHQASARLNTLAAKAPLYLSLKAPAWRRNPLALSEPLGPVIGFVVSGTVPGRKETLGRAPLGLEPPLRVNRALRWPGRDRKKTLESSTSRVPALHREAEHDATGNIGRQHPVHTWIGDHVQGKRRTPATLRVIHGGLLKVRLTVSFYCGMRLLGGTESFGGPRKSSRFTGFCAVVRRSIGVRGAGICRPGSCQRCRRTPVVDSCRNSTRPGGKLSGRHGCEACRRRQADPVCPRSR